MTAPADSTGAPVSRRGLRITPLSGFGLHRRPSALGANSVGTMRTLAAWCHDRRRTVIGLWVAAFFISAGLWATAAGEFVNNFNLPGTESQRAYDLLKEQVPGPVRRHRQRRLRGRGGQRARQAHGDRGGPQGDREVARGAGRRRSARQGRAGLRGRQDHVRADPVAQGRRRRRPRGDQDDGRGHARARRRGRRPGGARRRHHPLVDGRAGRRRRDLRPARRGARAVPDARRGRHGAAAAQRPVRDDREPRR